MRMHGINFAMSELTCTDWQGKAIQDGEDFYPYEADPCHMCSCYRGESTMCKSVSCSPPNCPKWRQISKKCCHYECLDSDGASILTHDNGTAINPPTGNSAGGAGGDGTMTDLGLRLVASTVTTFLILALLLFLIHRFRQRRLLLTLRRYNRRREPLDDSDNISYSPDFFGVQCPPYEDPPPPYTPPKPHPGEQPPPYEALETNNNPENEFTGRNNEQTSNVNNRVHSTGRSGNCGSSEEHLLEGGSNSSSPRRNNMVTRGVNTGITVADDNAVIDINRFSAINANGICVDSGNNSSECSNSSRSSHRNAHPRQARQVDRVQSAIEGQRASVHFRNSSNGQPNTSIAMGIQNRNRNLARNRSSDTNLNAQVSPLRNCNGTQTECANALNLELRNAVLSWRSNVVHGVPHGGECSSSSTDIGESTTSAESLTSSPESPAFDLDTPSEGQNNQERVVDDAETTVKRFLDRQFGQVPKGRRYPTTMSQSWTSPQGASPGQNFKQSISLGAFPANGDVPGQSVPQCSRVDRDNKPLLPRSKSEHLKTNGSLINHPFNGVVKPVNYHHNGHGARVAYKEPDELSQRQDRNSNQCNHSASEVCSSHDLTFRSDVSECGSITSNVSNLAAAILDPGDIIVTKRQDELRKLRLSHLLNKPVLELNIDPSSASNSVAVNHQQLQRSLSDNSVDSSCVSNKPCDYYENVPTGFTIRNDSKYPSDSYRHFLQTCLSGRQEKTRGQSQRKDRSVNDSNFSSSRKSEKKVTSSTQSSPRKETSRVKPRPDNSMIHSWHAGVADSGDENTSGPNSNTLARNSNVNFEKKSCGSKDVSNVFLPLFKPSNLEMDSTVDRGKVPDSEMRASAAAMYSCETEDRPDRKERRHMFKRHSMGCFPAKHTDNCVASHHGQRAHHLTRFDNVIGDVNMKKRNTAKDQRSKRISAPATSNDSHKVEQNAPYLMHSAIPRDFALLDHDIPALFGIRHSDNRSKKRSKSQGRGDPSGNGARKGSGGSRARRKPQQACLFHQELEQVLSKQRSPAKHTPADIKKNNSAISQV
ncbi:uncharacterized protein DDB_G0283357-like isoform X2 [Mya arenaria]|uniref:uncharacterized protein DDB_G0283357-like isoform X2 n=1 Tax=Mya arenaria TaxID=6604 RepID=UPI0022E6E5E9|nr:uncharacterized protein DDB_G0283357-like isoform X2 [Mya arenaria]